MYCDKSLLRTAYIWEMCKAAGMDYTPEYKIVELYLNGEFWGTYYFTDQVERSKHRVVTDDDGYLIEDDNAYYKEPLWFETDLNCYYTFKYPKATKEINEGDDSYKFITSYISQAEASLVHILDNNYDYKQYFDIESFAKWYLVSELSALLEVNFFYILKNRTSKLKMYPIWDMEFSFALTARGTDYAIWALPPTKPDPYVEVWKNEKYFKFMFKDRQFVTAVKNEWLHFKSQLPDLKKAMKDIRETLIYTQQKHFEKYPILDDYLLVNLIALGSWETEADYVDNIFEKRLSWFDTYIDSIYGE